MAILLKTKFDYILPCPFWQMQCNQFCNYTYVNTYSCYVLESYVTYQALIDMEDVTYNSYCTNGTNFLSYGTKEHRN